MVSSARYPSREWASGARLGEPIERNQGFEQFGHGLQRHHRRAFAGSTIGVLMGFDKDRSDADRDRGACENRRELTLATRTVAQTARLRHRMGCIEHDRIAGLRHDWQ